MQHRVGFVIDCQTSRTKVNLKYIELVQKVVCDIGLRKWSLVIVLGPRQLREGSIMITEQMQR